MSHNEITGDKLQSKVGNTEAYSKGYDAIFNPPPTTTEEEVEDWSDYEGCSGECAG